MKKFPLIVGAAMASLLVGCSTPVVLAPVGPGPFASRAVDSDTGSLQVYSRLVTRDEGSENPVWRQHSHYYISDANGLQKRYIDNTVGRYEREPRTVHLRPGTYMVRAIASGGKWVELPVVIKRGETTVVHLDDRWNAESVPAKEIVSMPGGYPVGWRGNPAPATGMD